MADDYEQTLLVVRKINVFKIPPRMNAAGHKAADWDLTHPISSGKLLLTGKGDRCLIRLEDANGELFALCPVSQNVGQTVEPVTDSSRYFVLRIEDGQGRHAFIGLGFEERNEAFDFNAALQDYHRHAQAQVEAQQAAQRLASQPKQDFSLKAGETIHVAIKTKHGVAGAQEKQRSTDQGPQTVPTLLPPPPGGRKQQQPQQHQSQQHQQVFQQPQQNQGQFQIQNQQAGIFFQQQQQSQPQQQNQQKFNDVSWGDFQGNQNQQQQQQWSSPQQQQHQSQGNQQNSQAWFLQQGGGGHSPQPQQHNQQQQNWGNNLSPQPQNNQQQNNQQQNNQGGAWFLQGAQNNQQQNQQNQNWSF